ncbi:MAG: hypothetical protein WC662_00510 [Candidatus Paceibacterota bacterium]|jgi:hypothetical protein
MEIQNKILSVSVFDSVDVKARVTFDSCVVDGIQITFWMDEEDVEERINSMFDILFKEVLKKRDSEKLIISNIM